MVWVDASGGQVPPGAVVAGKDNNENVYVARAMHQGCLIPGKLIASHKCAYIAWGSEEHKKSDYQVLVGGPNNWVPTSGSNVPLDAFRGGETEDGEPLYVGRADYKGNMIPGKVQKSHGVCYVCYDGKEHTFKKYEILMP